MVHKAFGGAGGWEMKSTTSCNKSLGPDLFDRAGRSLPESSMHVRSQLKKMIGHGEDVVVPALKLSPGAGEDGGARMDMSHQIVSSKRLQPPQRLGSLLNVAADLICA